MRFDRHGITFDYPDNWSIDANDPEEGLTVSVSSPDGGFWTVSGHDPSIDPATLAEEVLRQMKEEYRDLDSEPAADSVTGCRLGGFDMNFYCLDLTNTAQVRTLATPEVVYVIFCQAEDREWEAISRVFAAMTTSFVTAVAASVEDDGTED